MVVHGLVLQLSSIGKISSIFVVHFTIPCLFLWTPHKRKGTFTPNDSSKYCPVEGWYNKIHLLQAALLSNICRENKQELTCCDKHRFLSSRSKKKKEKKRKRKKKEQCYRVSPIAHRAQSSTLYTATQQRPRGHAVPA